MDNDQIQKHTQTTMKEAFVIVGAMMAALFAAEGRMPDLYRIVKFVFVYVALIVILKINHGTVATQILTAASIGCGSKLMEVLTKR